MPTNEIACLLDAETRARLAQLAYKDWTEKFDQFKFVKAEKPTNEPDWEAFHAIRLVNHTKMLENAKHVLDQIGQYAPLILGK